MRFWDRKYLSLLPWWRHIVFSHRAVGDNCYWRRENAEDVFEIPVGDSFSSELTTLMTNSSGCRLW